MSTQLRAACHINIINHRRKSVTRLCTQLNTKAAASTSWVLAPQTPPQRCTNPSLIVVAMMLQPMLIYVSLPRDVKQQGAVCDCELQPVVLHNAPLLQLLDGHLCTGHVLHDALRPRELLHTPGHTRRKKQ